MAGSIVKESVIEFGRIPGRTLPGVDEAKVKPNLTVTRPPDSLPARLPPVVIWQQKGRPMLLCRDDFNDWTAAYPEYAWPDQLPALFFDAEDETGLIWQIGQTLQYSTAYDSTAVADMVAAARFIGGHSIRRLAGTLGISKTKVDVYLTISRMPWWLRYQVMLRFNDPSHEHLEFLERALEDGNLPLVQALLQSSGKRKDLRSLNQKFKKPPSGLQGEGWANQGKGDTGPGAARAARRIYYPGVQAIVGETSIELYLPNDPAYQEWLRSEIEKLLEAGEAKFEDKTTPMSADVVENPSEEQSG